MNGCEGSYWMMLSEDITETPACTPNGVTCMLDDVEYSVAGPT